MLSIGKKMIFILPSSHEEYESSIVLTLTSNILNLIKFHLNLA
jgi:hypothetical protein